MDTAEDQVRAESDGDQIMLEEGGTQRGKSKRRNDIGKVKADGR